MTQNQHEGMPPYGGLTPARKERIDAGFETKTGLDTDTINVWSTSVILVREGRFDNLKPLEHYREYIQRQNADPGAAAYILAKSLPEAIAKFDALVDEFNQDFERIRREQDAEIVERFFKRAKKLIQNEE